MQHQQVIQIYTVITKDYSADPFQLLDKAMWKSNRITTGLVSYTTKFCSKFTMKVLLNKTHKVVATDKLVPFTLCSMEAVLTTGIVW